ncbi:FAD-binding monooxygenase [Modestobacter sp. I12A-02628]|uniref:FAD-binding monooxygenase n=1 Tax=Goekera deserti TaxID=2497753 RepID=A0A7K3WFK1_9ACTN|nr:FAD-dependent monooxygenase [Goekera deserti]MPR00031.1 FAD-binding monooxygenase [Goekera deserti]NDI49810.1 FAD-binding monooxygenase [Goekera deserti]NEL55172.1 FAD-binding monooxygenase [Goekera deserti]
MTSRSILVSGASIAGPTLAYWLARAGWEVAVVERTDALREEGQNIDVRGAAREVLRRMGLEDAALAATTGEQGTVFLDAQGRELARFTAGTDDTSGPTAELEILRGRLGALLHDATAGDVSYLFGDQIAGLGQDAGGVDVTFASGREQRFDLVVLAEGVNSRSRALVLPDARKQHLGMYVAYLTIPRRDDDTDEWRWFVVGGGRGVSLRPDDVGTIRASVNLMSDTRGLDELDRSGQVIVLRRAFADVEQAAPRVLAALEDGAPFYLEDLAQMRLPTWSAGRVAVVGDAAWCATPVSGIGTTLALSGAYTLAACLAGATDHHAGLAEYERRMRPFVGKAQSLPPGTPRVANPRSALGTKAFGAALRVIGSAPAQRLGGVLGGIGSPPADQYELPAWPTCR